MRDASVAKPKPARWVIRVVPRPGWPETQTGVWYDADLFEPFGSEVAMNELDTCSEEASEYNVESTKNGANKFTGATTHSYHDKNTSSASEQC